MLWSMGNHAPLQVSVRSDNFRGKFGTTFNLSVLLATPLKCLYYYQNVLVALFNYCVWATHFLRISGLFLNSTGSCKVQTQCYLLIIHYSMRLTPTFIMFYCIVCNVLTYPHTSNRDMDAVGKDRQTQCMGLGNYCVGRCGLGYVQCLGEGLGP